MIEDVASTVLSSPFATPILANLAMVGLGMLSVQQGNTNMAKEQYEAIKPRKGSLLIIPGLVADRMLGLQAYAGEDLDKASVFGPLDVANGAVAAGKDISTKCDWRLRVLLRMELRVSKCA